MPSAPKIALGIGFATFCGIMVALLIPTVISQEVPTYLPTASGITSDTLTVDAGDEHRWRFVDLDRRSVVDPPDTAGWDIMLRRFHFVPSGEIANLGPLAFDSVRGLPDTGYVRSTFARDTSNKATARWYTYSYFSHLLSPRNDIYILRGRDGRRTKIEILSYYCPGPTPGCTTFRYEAIP